MDYGIADVFIKAAKGIVEAVSAITSAVKFYSLSKVDYSGKGRLQPSEPVIIDPKELETMVADYFGDLNLRLAVTFEKKNRPIVPASEIARRYGIPEETVSMVRIEVNYSDNDII